MRMSQRWVMLCSLALVVALTASAAAQQRRGGFGFGFGRAPQGLVSLAAQEPVQKDLGLSADVVGKISPLNDEYRAAIQKEMQAAGTLDFQGLRDLPEAERAAKLAEYTKKTTEASAKVNTEYTPKLQAIVGADSIKRLKQIQIQAQGSEALATADVAAELKLTDDQKKKLADLATEYTAKQRELFNPGTDQQEARAKRAELNKERDTKAEALLTAEQKSKYTALKGPAFDVSTLSTGRGRRGNNN
ncbi:MAG TPA: hypothetical protein VFB80_13945 [Pirellulaceae bacterium]|nr:hypothetical protein [Pirellulaceae bacterium]